MALRKSIVKPLKEGDVDKVRLDFLFQHLQHLVLRFVVGRLNLLYDVTLLGNKLFQILQVKLIYDLRVYF